MSNRLLSQATNVSPQTSHRGDALVQARTAGTDASKLVPVTRAALDQLAMTYVDRGAEPNVFRGGGRPVRMSRWASLATLMCISVEVLLVIVRLNGDDQFIVYGYFATVGTLLAAIDIAVIRLPDWLTLPSYPAVLTLLGLNAVLCGDGAAMVRAVESGGMVVGFFLLLCLCTDTGPGDVLTELSATK